MSLHLVKSEGINLSHTRLITVATADYLDKVLVLFQTARLRESSLSLTLILADCTPARAQLAQAILGPDVDILTSDDLKIAYLENMRLYYSALEFCSALKVLSLAHFASKGEDCLYLDPDTVMFDSFCSELGASSKEILISPHTFTSYPADQDGPQDLDLVTSGPVNGGIIWVRGYEEEKSNDAVKWLVSHTRHRWFVSPQHGMYADQHWLSLLPYFFSEQTDFFSDLGINVAYWNLHERQLTRESSSGRIYLQSGESLKVFHFSGFDSTRIDKISRHSHRTFDPSTTRVLSEMSAEYKASLEKVGSVSSSFVGDLRFSTKKTAHRMRLARRTM